MKDKQEQQAKDLSRGCQDQKGSIDTLTSQKENKSLMCTGCNDIATPLLYNTWKITTGLHKDAERVIFFLTQHCFTFLKYF